MIFSCVSGRPCAHSIWIPVDFEIRAQAQLVRRAGQKDIVRSMRQVFLRPAGKPRFARAILHPPWPSGTSRLSGCGLLVVALAMATLTDESVGCSHPLRDQPERAARGHIVAQVDFDIMIAGDALVLAAAEGIEILAVERADDVRSHRCRGRRWRAQWRAAVGDGGHGQLDRRHHEPLVGENFSAGRMVDDHQLQVVVVVGLPLARR